jgi:ADP-ribose pyrophosphatase YjhB (NUDIX family)
MGIRCVPRLRPEAVRGWRDGHAFIQQGTDLRDAYHVAETYAVWRSQALGTATGLVTEAGDPARDRSATIRFVIAFDIDRGRFNYRVAAVVIDDGYLLAGQEVGADFWFLPGGRCEIMESSHDAVMREFREEFDVDCEVHRLLWIAENFFRLAGKTFHEVGLYFLVSLPKGSPVLDKTQTFRIDEAGIPFQARWFSLADVPAINLVPAFLRTGVQALPTAPEHLVFDEIGR